MKTFCTLLLALLITQNINAKTFFVVMGKTGNGSSWENASGDLAAVLFAARKGDEIWVAAGTYTPTSTNDRNSSFIIADGIKVYGGFLGTETMIPQRNWIKNKTILSGEIGQKGQYDNSFTVIYTINTGKNTLLDGFIIEQGCANQGGLSGALQKSGGAMYIDGQGLTGFSALMIRNCIFQNNYARDGGAVYINGRSGKTNPTFVNCQFYNNRTDLDGGAIFNNGSRGGTTNPVFIKCKFKNNEGNYGGVMCNYAAEGTSNPVLTECLFENNTAYVKGDCMFNFKLDGMANPELVDCQFMIPVSQVEQSIFTANQD